MLADLLVHKQKTESRTAIERSGFELKKKALPKKTFPSGLNSRDPPRQKPVGGQKLFSGGSQRTTIKGKRITSADSRGRNSGSDRGKGFSRKSSVSL
nr:unnamed protein product [Callosobruchus analis]